MLPYRPRAKQGTLPITQEFRHVTDTGIFCRITGGAEADTVLFRQSFRRPEIFSRKPDFFGGKSIDKLILL